jgi:hypothetical protein
VLSLLRVTVCVPLSIPVIVSDAIPIGGAILLDLSHYCSRGISGLSRSSGVVYADERDYTDAYKGVSYR